MRAVEARCDAPAADATASLPDAWIENIDAWHAAPGRKLRKDLAYARRGAAALSIEDGLPPTEAYRLYLLTVGRHGGRARYNAAYFHRLSALCHVDRRMVARCYRDRAGDVVAFAIGVRNEDSAYYLHAAANVMARGTGISDLLLEHLAARAREWGCRRFDLMASPESQPGLIAFKRKWGNRFGFSVTRDHACTPLGGVLTVLMRARRAATSTPRWLLRE
ncbi:GNAT family N-acetyltransferase [Cognatilysobacter lacus]